MSLSNVSVIGPLHVELLPRQEIFPILPRSVAEKAAVGSLCVSVLSLLVTTSLTVLIWWLGTSLKQQERLQCHVSSLSDTDAMHVIGQFKETCQSINKNYAHVYRDRKQVTAPAKGGGTVTITHEQLQQVSVARSKLQGIWDNIMDDFRAELLGEPITHPRQGRMLRRGLNYMKLVEPLEAANFAYLQRSDPPGKDPYFVRSAAQTAAAAAAAPSPPPPPIAAAAAATAAAVPPGAAGGSGCCCGIIGSWNASAISVPMPPEASDTTAASSNTLFNKAPRSCAGARPSRFKWLENQKTVQVLSGGAPSLGGRLLRRLRRQPQPQQLWSAEAMTAALPSGQTVKVFEVEAGAAALLEAGGPDAEQWARALLRHWKAVQDAYPDPDTPETARANGTGTT